MKEFKIIKANRFPKKYCAIFKSTRKKVCFGDRRYQQYKDKIGMYKKLDHGDANRRRLYRIRHNGEQNKKYSPGWFAWNYLW